FIRSSNLDIAKSGHVPATKTGAAHCRRRFKPRALDVSDHNIPNTGLNLNGNLPESLHNLRASVPGFAIVECEVCKSADRLFEHDLAIDHHDKSALVLQTPRIKADCLVREKDSEAVFA